MVDDGTLTHWGCVGEHVRSGYHVLAFPRASVVGRLRHERIQYSMRSQQQYWGLIGHNREPDKTRTGEDLNGESTQEQVCERSRIAETDLSLCEP
jgi:hypothetical protein